MLKTVNSRSPQFLLALVGMLPGMLVGTDCYARAKSHAECLSYEPSVVKLSGTLVRKTFPGPPNYESVTKGDKPEVYWMLNLLQPICVNQDNQEPDLNPAQTDVRVLQLVVNPVLYKTNGKLVDKRVAATGTLFSAITAHHHTPVLLTVTALDEAKAE